MQQLKKYFKLPPKKLCIIYGTLAGLLLVSFLVVYLTFGKRLTEFVSNRDVFNAWLMRYNKSSAAVFVLIRAFQTVIKIIPAEPLEIAAGYAWGTWGGLLYCSIGTFLGSLVIVALSKTIGAAFVNSFVNEEQLKLLKIATDTKKKDLFVWIFYLIPGTPKDIFTYIVSSTDINLGRFFAITTVARIPSIITSTICGSQLRADNYKTAAVVFVATAAISAASAWIYKKKDLKLKKG